MKPMANGTLPRVAIAFVVAACSAPTPKAAQQVGAAQRAAMPVTSPTLDNSTVKLVDFAAPGGRMGGHGMIIFGDASGTFMSHIPMFHVPHDAQVILQVTLSGLGATSPDMSDANYTFAPDDFSLNDLVSGRISSFTGSLFRGNFEQGGVEVAKQVEVKVAAVLAAKALKERTGATDNNEFWLIGGQWREDVKQTQQPGSPQAIAIKNAQTAWAIHRIDSAPSYDLVARVDLVLDPGRKVTTSSQAGYRFFTYDERNQPVSMVPRKNLRGYFAGSANPNVKVYSPQTDFGGLVTAIGSCLIGPDFTKTCP
jgi:hypothetical protein